jgi:hypothetical protein
MDVRGSDFIVVGTFRNMLVLYYSITVYFVFRFYDDAHMEVSSLCLMPTIYIFQLSVALAACILIIVIGAVWACCCRKKRKYQPQKDETELTAEEIPLTRREQKEDGIKLLAEIDEIIARHFKLNVAVFERGHYEAAPYEVVRENFNYRGDIGCILNVGEGIVPVQPVDIKQICDPVARTRGVIHQTSAALTLAKSQVGGGPAVGVTGARRKVRASSSGRRPLTMRKASRELQMSSAINDIDDLGVNQESGLLEPLRRDPQSELPGPPDVEEEEEEKGQSSSEGDPNDIRVDRGQ